MFLQGEKTLFDGFQENKSKIEREYIQCSPDEICNIFDNV